MRIRHDMTVIVNDHSGPAAELHASRQTEWINLDGEKPYDGRCRIPENFSEWLIACRSRHCR
jgi:hypothetical protein